MGRITLVERVRDELVRELNRGAFAPGEKMPNEDDLAGRFEVSRATIREAVRGLVEAGYVSRVHGSGTYVTGAAPRQHALDATLSYTQMISAAGAKPGLAVLDAHLRDADEEETARLRLADDAPPLLVVERVRTADDRPVVYSLDRIPTALIGPVDLDAIEPSLYALLAQHGHTVRSATARLSPVIADARLAKVLAVKRGSALQHIDQTDFDATGKPVLLSREWHVPDIFELRINRKAGAE
jgi:GntR family transcriptional regulator